MSHLLNLKQSPDCHQAKIYDGVLKTWKGKYFALIDGPFDAVVFGKAYELESKEHEDILRYHETMCYESVRYDITFIEQDTLVPGPGQVFRFCGPRSGLTDDPPGI